MRYIKEFRLFESSWSFEEYISYLTQILSRMNVTPVNLEFILNQKEDDIRLAMENGLHPQVFVQDLIKELELDPSSGFLGYLYPKSPSQIQKYL
jgi:hypothetical protein